MPSDTADPVVTNAAENAGDDAITTAVGRALDALAAPREAFDTALALTAEEVRGFLDTHRDPEEEGSDRVAAELGAFGSARIDPERFTSLVEMERPVDVEAIHRAEKGWAGLLALRERGADLHAVRVPSGGDLVGVAVDALAEAGRAFGLARAVRFVRNGGPESAAAVDGSYPPALWSASERALAPPLVIDVDGVDLRVSGLGDVLDGAQKLILVVRGPAPPAPLARLIRPGLMVMQCTDPDALDELGRYDGAAVAALLPEGAAVFTHDPRNGKSYAGRLTIASAPDADTVSPVGALSLPWVLEDLEHLHGLAASGAEPPAVPAAPTAPSPKAGTAGTPSPGAAVPAVPAASTAAVPHPPEAPATLAAPADPADRLAGWLLEQAGLGE